MRVNRSPYPRSGNLWFALLLSLIPFTAFAHGEAGVAKIVLFVPAGQFLALLCIWFWGFFWKEKFVVKFAIFGAVAISIFGLWHRLEKLAALEPAEIVAVTFLVPVFVWSAGYFIVRGFRLFSKSQHDKTAQESKKNCE